jgi:four helix bundle protein
MSNDGGEEMSNDEHAVNYEPCVADGERKFDLAERTSNVGKAIIRFARTIPVDIITSPLISQLVRSGTSIGANYREADGAESKKDFQHKIGVTKKEAKETLHWLEMIAEVRPDSVTECRKLWKEVHELTLIFSAIIRSSAK